MKLVELLDEIKNSDKKPLHTDYAAFENLILESRDYSKMKTWFEVATLAERWAREQYTNPDYKPLLKITRKIIRGKDDHPDDRPTIHVIHPFGQTFRHEYWNSEGFEEDIYGFMNKLDTILEDEKLRDEFNIALHTYPEDFASSEAFVIDKFDEIHLTPWLTGEYLDDKKLSFTNEHPHIFVGAEVDYCLDKAIYETLLHRADKENLFVVEDMALTRPDKRKTYIERHYTERAYKRGEPLLLPGHVITLNQLLNGYASGLSPQNSAELP